MTYVIMAIQEEGNEIRLSDYDEHSSGFDTRAAAASAADRLADEYVEYRQIWVEELKDAAYWYARAAREEYDDYDHFDEYGE